MFTAIDACSHQCKPPVLQTTPPVSLGMSNIDSAHDVTYVVEPVMLHQSHQSIQS